MSGPLDAPRIRDTMDGHVGVPSLRDRRPQRGREILNKRIGVGVGIIWIVIVRQNAEPTC